MHTTYNRLLAALAGAAIALTGCAAEQPSPGCYVQDGTWFFRYANPTYGGNCTGAQQTAFRAFEGEVTGVYKYKVPEEEGAQIAIRPRRAGQYGNQTEGGEFVNNDRSRALGRLPDEPTGEGTERYCDVTDLSVIDVPSATVAGAARRYTFSDVQVYAGARSLGTQLRGRVTVEDVTAAGTCTLTADVLGVWPHEPCSPELMGNADAAPADTCGQGSGMNQDVQYTCINGTVAWSSGDARTYRCAPANPTPSFKPGVEELSYAD